MGLNCNLPEMAVLGFCGGFLHLYNHSVLKAMLFLGAGSIHLGTGTYKMEKMGGLLKKMPVNLSLPDVMEKDMIIIHHTC